MLKSVVLPCLVEWLERLERVSGFAQEDTKQRYEANMRRCIVNFSFSGDVVTQRW